MIRHVASLLLASGLMTSWAAAQSPSAKPSSQLPPPLMAQRPTDPARSTINASARRAMVRPNPRDSDLYFRRTTSVHADLGFINPGGVGRYDEYYGANTPTTQVNRHPVPPARFDRGGGPDRGSQIAAAQVGQQRARNIQNNINAYGRPYGAFGAGFGYGLGLGVGRLSNYPY